MKKYLIAISAILLVACNNAKSDQKPVVPDTPADSTIANMRDSLQIIDSLGNVVEETYSGILPVENSEGIKYDLNLFFQEKSVEGVFSLATTYLKADKGQDKTFYTYGHRKSMKGSPQYPNDTIYELQPSNGDLSLFFLSSGDSMILLNQYLEKADSGTNFTLKLIK